MKTVSQSFNYQWIFIKELYVFCKSLSWQIQPRLLAPPSPRFNRTHFLNNSWFLLQIVAALDNPHEMSQICKKLLNVLDNFFRKLSHQKLWKLQSIFNIYQVLTQNRMTLKHCLPADHRKNAILTVSVVYLWSAGQNQNWHRKMSAYTAL